MKYLKISIITIILISCFGQIPSANGNNEEPSNTDFLTSTTYWYTTEPGESRTGKTYQRWRFYSPNYPELNLYARLYIWYYINGSYDRRDNLEYKVTGSNIFIKYDNKEYKFRLGRSLNRVDVGNYLSQIMFNARLYKDMGSYDEKD